MEVGFRLCTLHLKASHKGFMEPCLWSSRKLFDSTPMEALRNLFSNGHNHWLWEEEREEGACRALIPQTPHAAWQWWQSQLRGLLMFANILISGFFPTVRDPSCSQDMLSIWRFPHGCIHANMWRVALISGSVSCWLSFEVQLGSSRSSWWHSSVFLKKFTKVAVKSVKSHPIWTQSTRIKVLFTVATNFVAAS